MRPMRHWAVSQPWKSIIRRAPTPLLSCFNLGVATRDLGEGNRGAILGARSTESLSLYSPINRHFLRRLMAVGLGEEVRGDLLSAVGVGRESMSCAIWSMARSRLDHDLLIVMSVSTRRQPTCTGRSRQRKAPSPGEQYFTTTCLLLASLMDALRSCSSSSSW
jgi:hypothetical protein